MRICLSNFPFERIGKIYQSAKVPPKEEARVFFLQIPEGCVGFLDAAGIEPPHMEWKFIIDNEEVNDEIGSISKPAIYDPPYLVRNFIAIYAKNNSDFEEWAQAYCNGICCEELTLRPIVEKQKEMVEKQEEELREKREIKKEIEEIKEMHKTSRKVFDKKVVVTDKVKMLYQPGGLKWTAVAITNIGPHPVYFSVNEWRRPEAPLDVNLTENIDLGEKHAINKIYFVCDEGKNATVYLRVLK